MKKVNYVAPVIEVLNCKVESGFAASAPIPSHGSNGGLEGFTDNGGNQEGQFN